MLIHDALETFSLAHHEIVDPLQRLAHLVGREGAFHRNEAVAAIAFQHGVIEGLEAVDGLCDADGFVKFGRMAR